MNYVTNWAAELRSVKLVCVDGDNARFLLVMTEKSGAIKLASDWQKQQHSIGIFKSMDPVPLYRDERYSVFPSKSLEFCDTRTRTINLLEI